MVGVPLGFSWILDFPPDESAWWFTRRSYFRCRMRATLTKIGEGAFADVFGCQKEGWDKLAVKVRINILVV